TGDCEPRSINVFEAGKTYFVFFLFTKKDTKQVYQIYVGSGFNPKDKNQFYGIKVTDTNVRYKYTPWDAIPWTTRLLGQDGKPSPTGEILEVTVDFSDPKIASNLDPNPNSATNNVTCKPVSFCKWNGAKNCGC